MSALSAAESAPFVIDTQSVESNVSGAFVIDTQGAGVEDNLSAAFTIDTGEGNEASNLSGSFVIDTGIEIPGSGTLSHAFVIDTRGADVGGLVALSSYFTIDTRQDFEKLRFKYDQWAALNTPAGQRGMNDGVDFFGVPNLMAFAMGWDAADRDTWYHARVQEVVPGGGSPRVWLRARRRNDLPELIWTWRSSDDLQGFPTFPALLESADTGLGPLMEQWDVRVPYVTGRNFYLLDLYYDETP